MPHSHSTPERDPRAPLPEIAAHVARLGFLPVPAGAVHVREKRDRSKKPDVVYKDALEKMAERGKVAEGWTRFHFEDREDRNVLWVLRPVEHHFGLIVVDVDDTAYLSRVGQTFGHTPMAVATGREGGGVHLYYRAPEGARQVIGLYGNGTVDFKVGNNYVVAPGSQHRSGATYQLLWNGKPRPLADLTLRDLVNLPVLDWARVKEIQGERGRSASVRIDVAQDDPKMAQVIADGRERQPCPWCQRGGDRILRWSADRGLAYCNWEASSRWARTSTGGRGTDLSAFDLDGFLGERDEEPSTVEAPVSDGIPPDSLILKGSDQRLSGGFRQENPGSTVEVPRAAGLDLLERLVADGVVKDREDFLAAVHPRSPREMARDVARSMFGSALENELPDAPPSIPDGYAPWDSIPADVLRASRAEYEERLRELGGDPAKWVRCGRGRFLLSHPKAGSIKAHYTCCGSYQCGTCGPVMRALLRAGVSGAGILRALLHDGEGLLFRTSGDVATWTERVKGWAKSTQGAWYVGIRTSPEDVCWVLHGREPQRGHLGHQIMWHGCHGLLSGLLAEALGEIDWSSWATQTRTTIVVSSRETKRAIYAICEEVFSLGYESRGTGLRIHTSTSLEEIRTFAEAWLKSIGMDTDGLRIEGGTLYFPKNIDPAEFARMAREQGVIHSPSRSRSRRLDLDDLSNLMLA